MTKPIRPAPKVTGKFAWESEETRPEHVGAQRIWDEVIDDEEQQVIMNKAGLGSWGGMIGTPWRNLRPALWPKLISAMKSMGYPVY